MRNLRPLKNYEINNNESRSCHYLICHRFMRSTRSADWKTLTSLFFLQANVIKWPVTPGERFLNRIRACLLNLLMGLLKVLSYVQKKPFKKHLSV